MKKLVAFTFLTVFLSVQIIPATAAIKGNETKVEKGDDKKKKDKEKKGLKSKDCYKVVLANDSGCVCNDSVVEPIKDIKKEKK